MERVIRSAILPSFCWPAAIHWFSSGLEMKRFTATEKWGKEWYQALSLKHKCLWQYLCDQCDHGGIFEPNFKQASFFIGTEITEDDLAPLGTRVQRLQSGKYAIVGFIRFQYGELSDKNRAHQSVFRKLKAECVLSELEKLLGNPKDEKTDGACMPLICPLQGAKEKEQDKEEEKALEGVQREPLSRELPATVQEAIEWASFGGVHPDFAKEVYLSLDGKGWLNGTGVPVTKWKSHVQGRWVKEQVEWNAKRKKENPISARLNTETDNHVAKLCRDGPVEHKADFSRIKPKSPEVVAMLKAAEE